MRLKVDTREKENAHILAYFDLKNVTYEIKNCSIGDYCNLDNPNIFVERKASWDEFAGNCGKQHDRFKRELERLDECGGQMIILIETTQKLHDWKPKRSKMKAETMIKIIESWKSKHKIEVVQCRPKDSGHVIFSLLREDTYGATS